MGEEGPELMKMKGGERIYNARDSLRIAAETSRQRTSRSSESGGSGAGGVQINLGGISLNVTASGGGTDIVEQIRRQLPEIGNEICRYIAVNLTKSYGNLPSNVEGI